MGNMPGCCAADREATASDDLYEDDTVKAMPLDEDSSDADDDGAHFSVKHAMELRKQGSEADKEDIQMLLVSPLDKLTNNSTGGISQKTRKEDSWMKARALGSVLDTKLQESEEKKKVKSSPGGEKKIKKFGGRKNKIPPRKLYVM